MVGMKVLKVLLLLVVLVVMFLGLNVLQVGFDGLRVASPGFVVSGLREAGVFAAFPDLMVGSLSRSWQGATAAQRADIEAALRQAADPQWLETQVTLVLEDVSAYTKGQKAALTTAIPVNELFERFNTAYAETGDPAVIATLRQNIPAEYRQPIPLSRYFPADLSALPQIHYWRLLPKAVGLLGLLVILLALTCLPLAGGFPGAARWTGTAFLLSGLVGVAGSIGLSLRVVPSLLAGFDLTAPDPSLEAVVELARGTLTTLAGRIVGAVRSSAILFLVIAIVLYILAAVVASARKRAKVAPAAPAGLPSEPS